MPSFPTSPLYPDALVNPTNESQHSIPTFEGTNTVHGRNYRKKNRRSAKRAAKLAAHRQNREDALQSSNELVVYSAGTPPIPPPPPSSPQDGTVDVPPIPNSNVPPTLSTEPMTIDEMRVTLYSLASPLHVAVKQSDLIEVLLGDHQIGYAIDDGLTHSLWLALRRFHGVVALAATAYANQQVIETPFNNSLPVVPTVIPDDLFMRLGMPRPIILSKVEPSRTNPLRIAFTSATLAIASWESYRRLALDTMTWLASAYTRSFNDHVSLRSVSQLLRIEGNETAQDNNQAVVLHPTASRYARQHAEYDPYGGSIVLDATR
ncbi:hypothetical protein CVT24_009891 [Panaeolus cyanescens]|uniref:Uncharacterized protein n=1 Tax=Panaeolus cyanescens TaxID=181874 RepID=A0A409WFE2_9AGAR|nr:hypothetical protein CVT24_009891 [Panaeolus cyanescens]